MWEKVFKERVSNFFLDFSVIGSSNPGEPIDIVPLHDKCYAWTPVLWSFEKL